MCEHCGCSATTWSDAPGALTMDLETDLLEANNRAAAHNREHFSRHGVLAVNLMSSPGAGKTRLLEATTAALGGHYRMAAIIGDLATENDAERLRARDIPAVQLTTGNACHLDAAMVHDALDGLELDGVDLLFIENVGNLVCPAAFDLGQHANVVLLAVTEGDDKPAKYPAMFRAADLVVLSKCDLLPHLPDFSPSRAQAALTALGRETPLIKTAVPGQRGTGEDVRYWPSIGAWLDWLEHALATERREKLPA